MNLGFEEGSTQCAGPLSFALAASMESASLSEHRASLPILNLCLYMLTLYFLSGCYRDNNRSETVFAFYIPRLISSLDLSFPLMVLSFFQSPSLLTTMSSLLLSSSFMSMRLYVIPLIPVSIFIFIPSPC